MDDQPSYQEIMRAERRAVALKIAVVAALLLVVMLATVHRPLLEHLGGWAHGDHDLLGRDRWAPPDLPVDPGAIAGVDLARIHAELIPSWFIAVANDPPGSSRIDRALAELRAAVAGDPQLAAIVEELHALASHDPAANAQRLYALTDTWNAHMDATGQRWQLESNVTDRGRGAFFYTKSYRVEAALDPPIGGQPVPLRVLRRVDHTNLHESYLGMVIEGDERALVVLDRVRDFALAELWPLFDPALDPELSAEQEAFAPLVRAEAGAVLTPAQVEVLAATARARWDQGAVALAMELRRACGAGIRLRELPWQGLDKSDLDDLERLARDGSETCPEVTLDEVDRLRAATALLRQTEALEPSLEALVAWAARATAVHELQHVADTRAHGAFTAPPCPDCDGMPASAGRELSAYLASLAWSGASSGALLQACAQQDGAHGWAVDWIDERLDGGCEWPPADLAARAQALAAVAFGERPPIALPATWPSGLTVR